MYYIVNDIAKRTGLSPYTIRFYAKEGLFPGINRNENGVRLFGSRELHWIYLIEHLKRTGMTIKEIKIYIDWVTEGNKTISNRLDFFKEKRLEVEKQITELNKTLDFITYKEWEYTKAYEAGTTSVIEDLSDDMISDDLRKIRDVINFEREYLENNLSMEVHAK